MSKSRVQIKIHKVYGFCCSASVRGRNGKQLYETRDFPHGHTANAYADAESWARDRGYEVAD